MEKEKNVRLSVEIPEEEHKYLKMCCLKLGVSIKDFVTKSVIERVDLWEDQWMVEKMKKNGEFDRKYTIGTRGDKSYQIFEDGEIKELISHEKVLEILESNDKLSEGAVNV